MAELLGGQAGLVAGRDSTTSLTGTTNFDPKDLMRLGVGLSFLIGVMVYASFYLDVDTGSSAMLVIAAIVGGYMAMNIGANDVANNVGPAVGSGALTMTAAIIIAAMGEMGGALIAGGDVVSTIKKGIIDPSVIGDTATFVWVMLAALLAGALWLNIATYFGAPVSTTHSIVGGVLGAGIAAGGWHIANWDTMGMIAASWVISPVLGGLIAALFLYLIKRTIVYQSELVRAARRVVPFLIAIMACAFITYLSLKGLKKIWKMDFSTALLIGVSGAVLVFGAIKPMIERAAKQLKNDRDSINRLFSIPLIFAAGLLSFAHGANDVANAVGPLAAINDALANGDIAAKAAIPLWAMVVGAIGIAIGLALYGPKLIRTVGSEITHLDQMRAFCIALAAAITVIIASQLKLPVSSTHIAIGGVFGVGFLREYLEANTQRMIGEVHGRIRGDNPGRVQTFLERFDAASIVEKGAMMRHLKKNATTDLYFARKDQVDLQRVYRKELTKRSLLVKIASAWVITVPASGCMA
jgi:PiT family inorganic phosphate transporter